jgi:hypothetical protein
MPMMDIGHVSVFVLHLGMLMLVGVGFLVLAVRVEVVIVLMSVFMDNWHMDVKMSMFLIRQQ